VTARSLAAPATLGRRSERRDALLVAALAVFLGLGVAEQPLLLLAGGAALLLLAAAIVRPDVATLLVLATVYSNAVVVGVKFHDLPTAAAALVPLLLVGPLGYRLLVLGEPLVLAPGFGWILAFLFVSALSALLAADADRAGAAVGTLMVEGVVLFVLVTNAVRDPRVLRAAVWTLLGVGGALALLSIVQVLARAYGSDFLGFAQVGEVGRVRVEHGEITQAGVEGPLGDRNRYAQALLVLVPLGLSRVFAERSAAVRASAAALTGVVGVGVMLTLSRGAAVAFVVVLAAAMAMGYLRPRHLVALVLAVALLVAAVPAYQARVSTLRELPTLFAPEQSGEGGIDSSARSRATENLVALLMFADRPLLGVGPDLYRANYLAYAEDARSYSDAIAIRVKESERKPHSAYLGLLAEVGIAGLVAFLGAAGSVLAALSRARRRARAAALADLAHTAAGFQLALVAYLATALFLHLAYIRYFWLALALAAATASVVRREAERAAP
jgi:putative inorganic carbon (HCO3(-)) transporter